MSWHDDHNEGPDAPKSRRNILGAQYVRMSTEHQRYSTENQSDAIAQYARQRGINIIRTYSDEGKSGLRIQGRDGLKQLLDDIQSGRADFEIVLVYDISRWGRFQDADESAYYATSASAQEFQWSIVPSNLKMTAARSRQLSKALSAPWPVNTAESFHKRCSPDNVA